MDPSQYFQSGSKGEIVTNQALQTINTALESGYITPEQANEYKSGLENSALLLKQSGGKNTNGFVAQANVIGELGTKYNTWASNKAAEEKRVGDALAKFNAQFERYKSINPNLDEETAIRIANAAGINPTTGAREKKPDLIAMNVLGEELDNKSGIAETNAAKPLTKEEIEAKTLKFQDQPYFEKLAAIKGLNKDELDPETKSSLIAETKARRVQSKQALKIFKRMEAAELMLNNYEVMREFGDSTVTNWWQDFWNTDDNAEQAALMKQLQGGSLAMGMQDVKETTGTAAGMAVEETKALANSISALDRDIPHAVAKRSLNGILQDSRVALEALGVDPDLYAPADTQKGIKSKVRDVMQGKEKFLFADERQYDRSGSTNQTGTSTPSGSIATQRLGALTTKALPLNTKILSGDDGMLPPIQFELGK